MDNKDENIWPRQLSNSAPFFIQGTINSPGKVAVYQNLNSTAHIYFKNSPAAAINQIPSDITYRAGKEITLLPGFTVDQGSTFHAYIQRYICSGNSDALNMRTFSDSTKSNSDSINYENDRYNLVPIHYTQSPSSDSDLNPTTYADTSAYSSRTSNNKEEIEKLQEILLEQYNSEKNITNSQKSSYFKRFSVIPNPNNGLFRILVNRFNDQENISVSIFDMKGIEIKRFENIYEMLEVDLSNFGKGIYMIKMFSSFMKEQELKKVVIQ